MLFSEYRKKLEENCLNERTSELGAYLKIKEKHPDWTRKQIRSSSEFLSALKQIETQRIEDKARGGFHTKTKDIK